MILAIDETSNWWNEQLMKWAINEMSNWWNKQPMKGAND